MLYVITIIFLFCDSHNDDDEEHPYMVSLSLLSSVTEDLPQTVLAINVVRHMTHLISGIQILKAMYGVKEPVIRTKKNIKRPERGKYDKQACMHEMPEMV